MEDWRKSEQIQAWTSARRAWSSAEEIVFGPMRPCRLRALTRSLFPRVFFARGEGGGSGAKRFSVKQYGKCFFVKSLLHLSEFKVNCNAGNGKRESLAEKPGGWLRKLFGRRRGQGQAGRVRP